jgi:hypothetical protein
MQEFEIVVLVHEVISAYLHEDPYVPILPIAELICRSCAFSLDSLCKT